MDDALGMVPQVDLCTLGAHTKHIYGHTHILTWCAHTRGILWNSREQGEKKKTASAFVPRDVSNTSPVLVYFRLGSPKNIAGGALCSPGTIP